MRRSIWGSFLFAVLVAGGLGIAGYTAYQAGYRQGLLETANDVVVHANGFYPGFGLFFGFIFLFFLFSVIGRIAFGRRRWKGGPPPWAYGRGMRHGEDERHPLESRLADWHQKAHSSDEGAGAAGDGAESDRRE